MFNTMIKVVDKVYTTYTTKMNKVIRKATKERRQKEINKEIDRLFEEGPVIVPFNKD